MQRQDPDKQHDENLRTAYSELCDSYRAIDDFRSKLLGYLPLATGAGMVLLFKKLSIDNLSSPHLAAAGAFGFAVTLGLFFYELYGIKKCTGLIGAGLRMEKDLRLRDGQFAGRPAGVAGFINEPFAAGVIYPSVLAAWTYLACLGLCCPPGRAWRLAVLVFLGGFAVSCIFQWLLQASARRKNQSEEASP